MCAVVRWSDCMDYPAITMQEDQSEKHFPEGRIELSLHIQDPLLDPWACISLLQCSFGFLVDIITHINAPSFQTIKAG